MPPRNFGRDHWSTFAYVETCCVDLEGRIELRKMRCNVRRHPQYIHGNYSSKHPTRLRGNVELHDHDDWDCLRDLWYAGFLKNIGTEINPRYEMRDLGHEVAGLLRKHKSYGGTFGDFYWNGGDGADAESRRDEELAV